MLTRYQKRQVEAKRLAANILFDYGFDYAAASDRVLALVNGQKWLERMVLKEMHYVTSKRRAA